VGGEVLACLKNSSQYKLDGRLLRGKYQEGILGEGGHGGQEGGSERPAEYHEYSRIRDHKEEDE